MRDLNELIKEEPYDNQDYDLYHLSSYWYHEKCQYCDENSKVEVTLPSGAKRKIDCDCYDKGKSIYYAQKEANRNFKFINIGDHLAVVFEDYLDTPDDPCYDVYRINEPGEFYFTSPEKVKEEYEREVKQGKIHGNHIWSSILSRG